MIQITSRGSRGARLRRGGLAWLYPAVGVGGLVVAVVWTVLHHQVRDFVISELLRSSLR
jgi:hypothetical protein